MQWPSQWSGCSASGSCGPSTAATMSASVICVGRAGEHVAAADAALRTHEARRPSPTGGSARGTAGEGACARRSPSPRSGGRCRAAPATAAPGPRSRRGSRPSWPHRRADGPARRRPPRRTLRGDAARAPTTPSCPTSTVRRSRASSRRSSAARRRVAARTGPRRPKPWCCSCSTASGGTRSRSTRA